MDIRLVEMTSEDFKKIRQGAETKGNKYRVAISNFVSSNSAVKKLIVSDFVGANDESPKKTVNRVASGLKACAKAMGHTQLFFIRRDCTIYAINRTLTGEYEDQIKEHRVKHQNVGRHRSANSESFRG